ncbi:hypothetical protein E2C01_034616 [Portunus trituberculatus]|uniref:Uncharacterized protein n=1 Tax=Portunus trituberculatus TaxID=210409 RepID=A0A5B7F6S8_PORTR|nr:hypothetical protein [Portunus trituberculatus]
MKVQGQRRRSNTEAEMNGLREGRFERKATVRGRRVRWNRLEKRCQKRRPWMKLTEKHILPLNVHRRNHSLFLMAAAPVFHSPHARKNTRMKRSKSSTGKAQNDGQSEVAAPRRFRRTHSIQTRRKPKPDE